MSTRRRLIGAVTALVLALTACTPTPLDRPTEPGPETEPEAFSWPDPSPARPVVDLGFAVSDDLTTVQGWQRVEFTPDLEVCELVFRLWPNKPFTAMRGNELEVTRVVVDQQEVASEVLSAGAPDDAVGTLLEVTLPSCVSAGTTLDAELDFSLTLGEGTDERVGVARAGDAAWFGTAFPLLAWENDRGWARDPAVRVVGEMATSETFRLRSLEVVAPSRYDVLGTGELQGSSDDEAQDTTTHRFAAPAVRDVTVSVGLLDVLSSEFDGVRLHVGAPRSGTRAPLTRWARELEQSIRRVADHLGPVPYEDIWVTVLPDQTDGIEFPGALQFGDVEPDEESWLVVHEVAHLWFYGLVGNNQARDPWLDEAFATFVQFVVDDEDPRESRPVPEHLTGQVGRPMTHWTNFDRPSTSYVQGVYRAGGAALLEARDAAGPEAFDTALIDYLHDNAHGIAVPADLEAALAELPEALRVLRRAGALPDVS